MLLSEEKISLLKPNKLINFVIMLTAENFPHDWYCQNLLVHGVHAVGEGEVDVVECKKHELNLCTVLHGDREHESIKSIDSLTHPEHACLDLAIQPSSYTCTYIPCHAYPVCLYRNVPLCLQTPRVTVSRVSKHRLESVGIIRMLRRRGCGTCWSTA